MERIICALCVFLATILISSTIAVPLTSEESGESSAQNVTNSTDIVRVLLFPVFIREQPIFIINQEDLVSNDNAGNTDVPVPSTDMLPPPPEAPVMPLDNRVNPEDDDWDVNSDAGGPNGAQQTTPQDYNNDERRKRDTSSDEDSNSAETSTILYEIDAWRFGPVLINETDPDTNSSEIGVLSVDVVRIAPVTLNGTDSNEDHADD